MAFNPPGGSGGIAGATDVTLDSPQDNEVLAYDGDSAKWQNQTGGASTTIIYHNTSNWIDEDGNVITARPAVKRVLAFGSATQPNFLVAGDVWVQDSGGD